MSLNFLRADLPDAPSFTVSQSPCKAKLDQNETPWDLPDELRRRILDEFQSSNWNRYPQPAEYEEAKKCMGETLNIEPENLILTHGCDQAIQGAHWLAGGAGKKAVVFEPTYPMMAHARYLSGTKVDRMFLGPDYIIDPQYFEGYDLIFIASPNNPTGGTTSEEVIQSALEHPALVFLDEAYYDLSGKTAVSKLKNHPNLLIGRSCSKSLLAGLRLGYALGHPEVIGKLERMLTAPYNLSLLHLILARNYQEINKHVRKVVRTIRSERKKLSDELAGMGLKVYPSEANFIMFEIDNPDHIFDGLVNAGVRIRNLTQIKGLIRHLRVTVGDPQENQFFLNALKNLL